MKAACLLVALVWVETWAGAVSLDATPELAGGANGPVYALCLQPDGKLLVGGTFNQFAGQKAQAIVRLLPSGAIDPEFSASGADGSLSGFQRIPAVFTMAVQPDGRILVAGEFSRFNQEDRTSVVRLLPDGALDPSFQPVRTVDRFGWNQPVYVAALNLATDGKITIGGTFRLDGHSPYAGGNLIARLNADGSEDTSLDAGPLPGQGDAVLTLASVGARSYFAGFIDSSGLSFPLIGHVQPGSPATFGPKGDAAVNALVPLLDGTLLGGGGFVSTTWPPPPNPWVARLFRANEDMSVAPVPGFFGDGAILSIRPEADGGVLIMGGFNSVNGVLCGGLARLTPDLRIDPCFQTGLLTSGSLSGMGTSVRTALRLPSGEIWIGGDFTRVRGVARQGLARLKNPADCPAARAGFAAAEYVARESDKEASVSVTLDRPSAEPVVVQLTTTPQTATPGEDYESVQTAITFEPGETCQTARIPLRPDSAPEDTEAVVLSLSGPPGVQFSRSSAVLQILDSDPRGSQWWRERLVDPGAAISSFWVDPAGKVLISLKTPAQGLDSQALVRHLSNGDPDPSWHPVSVDHYIWQCQFLPDGRTVMVGSFSRLNGTPVPGIAWLLPDGQMDRSVQPLRGSTLNKVAAWTGVWSVAPQDQGATYLGGAFTVTGPAGTLTNVDRLKADGSVDTDTFVPVDPRTSLELISSPDGSVLVPAGEGWRRILPDGRLDLTFVLRPWGYSRTRILHVLFDGRLMGVGQSQDGTGPAILRFLQNGALDPTFPPLTGIELLNRDLGPEPFIPGIGTDAASHPYFWGTFDHVHRERQVGFAWLSADGRLDPWQSVQRNWGTNSFITKAQLSPSGELWIASAEGPDGSRLHRYLESPAPATEQIRMIAPTTAVNEANTSREFEIVRVGPVDRPTSVRLLARGLTARSGDDFAAVDETVTFAPGERVRRFHYTILDDRLVEPQESFTLALSPLPGGSPVSPKEVLITIDDEDYGFALDHDRYTMDEREGVVAFRVSLTGSTPNFYLESRVRVTTSPVTASAGQDYVSIDEILSFSPGRQTSHWISLRVLDDVEPEATESLDIRITPLESTSGITGREQARVYIRDDDQLGQPARGVDGPVLSMAALTNGMVLIAGGFERVDGQIRRAMARLDRDGRLDSGFSAAFGPGTTVHTVAVDADGRILAAGNFTNVGDASRQFLVRLLPSGELDPEFPSPSLAGVQYNTYTDGPVIHAVRPLANGRVLIGGVFSWVNGMEFPFLARLLPDGNIDPDFTAELRLGSFPGNVSALEEDAEGRIVVGGRFNSVSGIGGNGIARLLSDGEPDPTFQSELTGGVLFTPQENWVRKIGIGPSGDLVLYRSEGAGGGWLSPMERTLARFREDGTRDRDFDLRLPFQFANDDPNGVVTCLTRTPDGGTLVAAYNQLIRLQPDGTQDPSTAYPIIDWPAIARLTPSPPGTVHAALVDTEGMVWLGGTFQRLGNDLETHLTRVPLSGIEPDRFRLLSPQVLPDGRIALILDSYPPLWPLVERWLPSNGWEPANAEYPYSQNRLFLVTPDRSPALYRILAR